MTQLKLNLPPGKSRGCAFRPVKFHTSTKNRREFAEDICSAIVKHVRTFNPPWVIVDGTTENACLSFRVTGQVLSPKAPRCPANRPIICVNARQRNLAAMDQDHAEESIFVEIQGAIYRWLKRIEVGIQPAPFPLLCRLVETRDCIPAAGLAHALLFQLAHQPLTNASTIFDICSLLQSSPDADQYSEAALKGLKAFSRKLNRMHYPRAAQEAAAADIHLRLYRMRTAQAPFPQGFHHIPNAQMSAVLL